jgi:hypothetical protein
MSEKSPSKKKLGFVGVVKRLVPIVVRATPVFFISFSVLAILLPVSSCKSCCRSFRQMKVAS